MKQNEKLENKNIDTEANQSTIQGHEDLLYDRLET